MRILLTIVAAFLALSLQAQAAEPRTYDEKALPHDDAGLSALDNKQLQMVSRATNHCDASEPQLMALAPAQRPCIVSMVDRAVDTSNDPALQAYHAALPFNARYDRFRPAYYWQQIAAKYH